MKILFIANYYPPSRYGWGYMQRCKEVADGLAARGHEIAVLTSTQRNGPEVVRPYPVHRLLNIEPDWQQLSVCSLVPLAGSVCPKAIL